MKKKSITVVLSGRCMTGVQGQAAASSTLPAGQGQTKISATAKPRGYFGDFETEADITKKARSAGTEAARGAVTANRKAQENTLDHAVNEAAEHFGRALAQSKEFAALILPR